jgi:hypothetical protein
MYAAMKTEQHVSKRISSFPLLSQHEKQWVMGLTYLWATSPALFFLTFSQFPVASPFERRAPRSMLEFVVDTQAFLV